MPPCRFSRLRMLAMSFLALAMFSLSAPTARAKAAKMLDIADTVANNVILTKLNDIIQNSELETFLSSRGPFTFFAPTNSAFSRLPPGELDELLKPENKVRLQRILLFHVVNGKRLAARDLLPVPPAPLLSLLSCEGSPLQLKKARSGAQYILKAKIIHADIKCANGLIHEIDTVLIPPDAPPLIIVPPPAPVTNAPSATPPESSESTSPAPAASTENNAPASEPPATNAAPVASPETNAAPSESPATNTPVAEPAK